MTDQELFRRFINKYGGKFPEFNAGTNYWDDLNKGYEWFKKHVPQESEYLELMERYYRAVFEIATIDEMVKRGEM